MGASLIVETDFVDEIQDHSNADRLDIVKVKGWYCVVKKGSIKIDDLIIYVPVDSVLPDKLANIIFPPDSKITIKNNRIKTIKIRGSISQGLVITCKTLDKYYDLPLYPGVDVKNILGITKYEPQEKSPFSIKSTKGKENKNENFFKYTDLNHFKNYPSLIQKDEVVTITEKIHGTNFRAGYVPINKSTPMRWWKMLCSLFMRNSYKFPGYEFVYGSHNVQLQNKTGDTVYSRIVDKYDLKNKITPGFVLYGEIYGDGIQKNYKYGLKNDIAVSFFDVMKNEKYLSYPESVYYISETLELEYVPVLYIGEFGKANLDSFFNESSSIDDSQKIIEGIVIRTVEEQNSHAGRKVLKYINPEYLLKKGNSDWH